MGLLWRLLAPKPIKKVQRSVRTVTNPAARLRVQFEEQSAHALGDVRRDWVRADQVRRA